MSSLLPGTQVKARGLLWEVLSASNSGEQQLYRLRCLAQNLRGMELDLLSPFEKIEPISKELNPRLAAPLAAWRLYMSAFLLEQELGPSALLAAQPGRLEIQPYQLVPVMRALRMSRPRLMLADGVGLGKTIQAGLVMAELIARRRAHRILIVCPAGPLLEQWQLEMRERFGLRFTHLNSAQLQQLQYQNELGANPFEHVALGIISIDFAKQERILQHIERASYDIVVIDEAHHCMSLGQIGDREDSQRRRLAEVLATRSDALLLLTATPHDGYDPHFASLMELLDPSLVDGKGSLRGENYKRHLVRRLKRHVKDPKTGKDLFKVRKVFPERVSFAPKTHPDFANFQEALLALVAPNLRRALKQRRYADVLSFVSLLKRSVSTVNACRNTLQAVAARIKLLAEKGAEAQEEKKQRLRTLSEYRRRLDRFGVLSLEDEQDQAGLEAEDIAGELTAGDVDALAAKLADAKRDNRRGKDKLGQLSSTHEALLGLIAMADAAAKEDPKPSAILEQIQNVRQAEPNANILVYTEYTDSQEAVVAFLKQALEKKGLSGLVVSMSGDDGEKDRSSITEQFRTQDGIILVSTDASAEGLNLHNKCHHLLHLELPYNPNRLEQRNGRIDRYGQKFEPIIRYLYLGGTFEERLLLRLVAKYERMQKRLQFVPNTLGISTGQGNTVVRLLEGFADEELQLFKQAPKPLEFENEEQAEVDSPAYKELLAEVERAFAGFDKAAKTNTWLEQDGSAADERTLKEAEAAQATAKRLVVADIVDFVIEAAKADLPHGSVQKKAGIWELQLNSNWAWDLIDTPGYDAEQQILRLTEEMDVTQDASEKKVGYLGRAHPIVRRALDRVRNLQFSGEGSLDRRVSAAISDESEPELLLTYVGRVESDMGTAMERVLAVRVGKDGTPKVFSDNTDWLGLTVLDRAIPTKEIWEKWFQGWAEAVQNAAEEAASTAFEPISSEFMSQQRTTLQNENKELDSWLRARVRELTGADAATQQGLFEGKAEEASWCMLTDPIERLSTFATEKAVAAKSRAEAQTVLKLYQDRKKDMRALANQRVPDVTLLGMLMLVPTRN